MKGLTFVSSKFQKEKRKYDADIISEETGNVPNLVKCTNLQIQEAQRIPRRLNPKKPTLRHIIIKLQKIKDKEKKHWKQSEKNYALLVWKWSFKWLCMSHQKPWKPEKSKTFLKWWKKRTVNPECYSLQKYISGMEVKWRHFQMKEN